MAQEDMTRRSLSTLMTSLRAAALLAGFAALLSSPASGAEPGSVVVLPTTGVVDVSMAGYLADSITRAANEGAAVVIIRLDTPGGELGSTHEIVKTLEDSPVPVVVWVAPTGSRAASAGTFITLAANVTAMAPSTNIGAASPISSDGSDIPGTLGEKVLNDAIAAITAIAEFRGRPVEWAVSTVKDAKSYTVDEAIAAGAIDIKATTLDELLTALDGRLVQVKGQPATIKTAGAPIVEYGMNIAEQLRHFLTDPNVAFILFTIGFYGLLFELQNPNFVTGILGAIAIVLAFIGFGSLPLNVGGLVLIGIAIVMFVLELTVTSHGLLAIGGVVCFILGASALYTEPTTPTAPSVEVAAPIIIAMTLTTMAFLGVVISAAIHARKLTPVLIGGTAGGPQLPLGTLAAVRRELTPLGTVYAAGEEWTARTANGRPLDRGTTVTVVGQEGLTLLVEPVATLTAHVPDNMPN